METEPPVNDFMAHASFQKNMMAKAKPVKNEGERVARKLFSAAFLVKPFLDSRRLANQDCLPIFQDNFFARSGKSNRWVKTKRNTLKKIISNQYRQKRLCFSPCLEKTVKYFEKTPVIDACE